MCGARVCLGANVQHFVCTAFATAKYAANLCGSLAHGMRFRGSFLGRAAIDMLSRAAAAGVELS